MACFFRSSSRHAIQVGVSEPKIISLYIVMVSLMASSSYSFIFIQFRRGIFNFLASSNSDVSCSFIYSFLQPQAAYKNLLSFFLHLKKSIIIITQHAALLVFCIGLFTLFNICLGMIIFTLFVYRIIFSTAVVLHCMSYGTS